MDDNFIGNKARLKRELLPALIAWQRGRRGVTFNTEASVNLADDPELMQMMVDAGFDMVFVGIETPDEKCLQECSKKQNTGRDLVADVKKIQRAGLQVQGGFIVGFDSDTPSIFRRQIEFIQKSGIADSDGGAVAGAARHAPLRADEAGEPHRGVRHRRQRGRHDEHRPAHGAEGPSGGVPADSEAHLLAQRTTTSG